MLIQKGGQSPLFSTRDVQRVHSSDANRDKAGSTSSLFATRRRLFDYFDELVGTSSGRCAFQAGVSNCFYIDLDRTDRVVVTRDHNVHAVWAAVGIDYADHGNAQLVGFLDRNMLVVYTNHEQGIRQAAHVLDTTDAALELFHLAGTQQGFFLGQFRKSTVLGLSFQLTQTTNGLTDGLVVGQHTTQPAMVDVGHAGASGFFLDDFAGSTLGANKQNLVLFLCQRLAHTHRLIQSRNSVLQVDDMNLVAGTENVLAHFRVPVTGLVTKMNTCLQQVTH